MNRKIVKNKDIVRNIAQAMKTKVDTEKLFRKPEGDAEVAIRFSAANNSSAQLYFKDNGMILITIELCNGKIDVNIRNDDFYNPDKKREGIDIDASFLTFMEELKSQYSEYTVTSNLMDDKPEMRKEPRKSKYMSQREANERLLSFMPQKRLQETGPKSALR